MTKMDLINKVACMTGLNKKQSAEAVSAVFGAMQETLAAGDKIQLVGFGTFEVRERAARSGRNPRKPEETIAIPSKKTPVFRPGKLLKESVNK